MQKIISTNDELLYTSLLLLLSTFSQLGRLVSFPRLQHHCVHSQPNSCCQCSAHLRSKGLLAEFHAPFRLEGAIPSRHPAESLQAELSEEALITEVLEAVLKHLLQLIDIHDPGELFWSHLRAGWFSGKPQRASTSALHSACRNVNPLSPENRTAPRCMERNLPIASKRITVSVHDPLHGLQDPSLISVRWQP